MSEKPNWKRARKKPLIIDFREAKSPEGEYIKTIDGDNLYVDSDRSFIGRGIKGELYPINKKIFSESYDILEESVPETSERYRGDGLATRSERGLALHADVARRECADPFEEQIWKIVMSMKHRTLDPYETNLLRTWREEFEPMIRRVMEAQRRLMEIEKAILRKYDKKWVDPDFHAEDGEAGDAMSFVNSVAKILREAAEGRQKVVL